MNEPQPFVLFGPSHLATLAALVAVSVALPRMARRHRLTQPLANVLAVLLVTVELATTWYRVQILGEPLRRELPLHLCDVATFLGAVMLVRRDFALYEVVYFWGMAGTVQALLTPDVPVAFPHPEYLSYFAYHGLIVVAALYATLAFGFRPTLRSVFKVWALTNLYALVVAPINLWLDANYLYLCRKPEQASLMNYMGPWPWYILALEGAALISFLIYYAPFAVASRWAPSASDPLPAASEAGSHELEKLHGGGGAERG